jgi:putative two-component system response regulator
VAEDEEDLLGHRALLGEGGYTRLRGTSQAWRVNPLCARLDPDLVLLDVDGNDIDGPRVLARLRALEPDGLRLPVLAVARRADDVRHQMVVGGAQDVVAKPLDAGDVLTRVDRLLEDRRFHAVLAEENRLLDLRVQDRTRELEEARIELLERLALAAEFRDDDTHAHTERVGERAAELARALGRSDDEIELLRRAAPLHDIGKIGVSDAVLRKPARLTPEEFAHVETHTEIGARILDGSSLPVLQLGREIARTHHERWDGTGYPDHLSGNDIPLAGRIVSVADVFDALTHARPYKEPWSVEAATEEIARQRGRQFDPDVVDAFLDLVEREVVTANGRVTIHV